jgi:hypothetical protein
MNFKLFFRNKNLCKLILGMMVLMLAFCFSTLPVLAEKKVNGYISSKADRHIEKYQFQDSAENEDAPKIPICKDFMANLKALGEPPMVCDRKFHPKFKQFTWPKWQKLDAWENRDLIYQIWEARFSYGRGVGNYDGNTPYAKASQFTLEYIERYLKQNIDSGDITLSVTRVQIDGKSTTVLQFMEAKKRIPCTDDGCFPCMADGFPSNSPFVRQHYIVDLSKRKVDFKATKDSVLLSLYGSANDGYFKAPEESVRSRFQGDANEHYADMFLYQGLPYVAFWYGDSQSGVLLLGSELNNNYCIIEYNATTDKGEKR